MSIWDQTIATGKAPKGFLYGTEYSREQINVALSSSNPEKFVPSVDEVGHGTHMAGVMCGNRDEKNGFVGVAPLASLCVVKCKEAKNNLKEYYRLDTKIPCYSESDIMLGIRYLRDVAERYQMPLVVCLGMGSNLGGHNRGGVLGEVMESYGRFAGRIMVASCGNEANASLHYQSPLLKPGDNDEVELRVGEGRNGFTTELWTDTPALYSVALISPSGEYSGVTQARLGESQSLPFLLEGTTVDIEYILLSFDNGDECIRIRFQTPAQGVWRIRVFNQSNLAGAYNMWLPIKNFLPDTTYFLDSSPDQTICEPANNSGIISVAYYNGKTGGVVAESGRGYTRTGQIKPDLAAPGVNIYGPVASPVLLSGTMKERQQKARYSFQSGSSQAAAVTAGASALLLEWGILRGNDRTMNTSIMQRYLIRGAKRETGVTFPNPEWGWGQLDLYGAFEALRPKAY